jgi:ADP-ribose pyrophosphatase YjhB (NUDIX family)
MIRFERGNACFNYRVAGVAVHEDSVLLHQADGEAFWTFPGGRVELRETAEETLRREMKEEIDADVEVVRLLWFVESFFTYADLHYHEIALYFLMRFPATGTNLVQTGPFYGLEHEGEVKLTFQWFPRQQEVLSRLPLLPSFLQTAVQSLPESVQHIVHKESSS